MPSFSKCNRLWVTILVILVGWGSVMRANSLEELLFDETTLKLGEAILDAGRRQAVYSYIIANAATPGIDLEKLLPPDDRLLFKKLLPEGEDSMEILVEFVLLRVGELSKRQGAFTALFKKKQEILKQVISKGQR